MRLKVKTEKQYKGDPGKGAPPLEIPLINGLYAKPGQEFSSDILLGGEAAGYSLLDEDPARVVEVEPPKPPKKAKGKKGKDPQGGE